MRVKPAVGFSTTVLRRKFGAGMTVRNYRDKEIVFSQGDTADAFFYIQSGTVKLTAVSTPRKRAIIAFLQPGGFSGEACLGGQSMRIYGAKINWGVHYHSTAKGGCGSHTQARSAVCDRVC
jgi:CRP/FNR family cyclic AMP-dependent transcriptional regulator